MGIVETEPLSRPAWPDHGDDGSSVDKRAVRIVAVFPRRVGRPRLKMVH